MPCLARSLLYGTESPEPSLNHKDLYHIIYKSFQMWNNSSFNLEMVWGLYIYREAIHNVRRPFSIHFHKKKSFPSRSATPPNSPTYICCFHVCLAYSTVNDRDWYKTLDLPTEMHQFFSCLNQLTTSPT